jgi:hypothetical protein
MEKRAGKTPLQADFHRKIAPRNGPHQAKRRDSGAAAASII